MKIFHSTRMHRKHDYIKFFPKHWFIKLFSVEQARWSFFFFFWWKYILNFPFALYSYSQSNFHCNSAVFDSHMENNESNKLWLFIGNFNLSPIWKVGNVVPGGMFRAVIKPKTQSANTHDFKMYRYSIMGSTTIGLFWTTRLSLRFQ